MFNKKINNLYKSFQELGKTIYDFEEKYKDISEKYERLSEILKDEKQQKVEGDIPITVTIGNSYYDYLKKDNIDVVKDYVLVKIAGENYIGFFSNTTFVTAKSITGNIIFGKSKCKIEVLSKIYNEKFIKWLGKNNTDIKINNGLINCYASYTVKIDPKSTKKYIDDLVFIEL